MSGDQFLQLLFDGILFGIMIALGALGLNLVFGTTGLTNFSHGDLLTLGAFTALILNEAGLHIIIAALIAIVIAAVLFGWGQNKVLWRPLRRRKTGLIAMMIISIGLAIVIRYGVALFFGGAPRNFNQYAGQPGIEIGPVSTTPRRSFLRARDHCADHHGHLGATFAHRKGHPSGLGQPCSGLGNGHRRREGDRGRLDRGGWAGCLRRHLPGPDPRQHLEHGSASTSDHLRVGHPWRPRNRVRRHHRCPRGGRFIQLTSLVIPTEMKTVGALFVMIVILMIRPQGILGRRERVG